jgi:hypothetical protein
VQLATQAGLGSLESGLYLASTAAWDICSAMPFGSELLPMLKAVPSLSSSNRLAI